MTRKRTLVALFAMVAIALLFAACGGSANPSSPVATATGGATTAGSTAAPAGTVTPLSRGSADAKVVLAAFEDFQCPYCLKFTNEIEPTLIKEYVDTGKVRYEYHNFVILGPESTRAAIGAYCAGGQDKFWAYHDRLFQIELAAGQLQGEKLNAGRFTDTALASVATDLGLDRAKFDACYSSAQAAQAVQDDGRLAASLKLQGTPTFTLNGKVVSTPSSIGGWRQLLNQALAAAQ